MAVMRRKPPEDRRAPYWSHALRERPKSHVTVRIITESAAPDVTQNPGLIPLARRVTAPTKAKHAMNKRWQAAWAREPSAARVIHPLARPSNKTAPNRMITGALGTWLMGVVLS